MNSNLYDLYLNTAARCEISLGLSAAGSSQSLMQTAIKVQSDDLLPVLADFLEKSGVQPAQITNITVHTDTGSYTGMRVGVAIAKTLALIWGITVNGKNPADDQNIRYTRTDNDRWERQ
jgi:tRNA A37 threonylcarbamoyladenosine modification protein TsaB